MKKIMTFVFAVFIPFAAWAGPIEDLQPGEWYEVPNSHLRNVAPCGGTAGGLCNPANGDPSQSCYNSYAIYDFSHIVWGWNGGAYDTKRDRLLVFGGGHGGWAGNDIYGFDLNTFQWSRLQDASCLTADELRCPDASSHQDDPALEAACEQERSGYYADGKPRARHTYNQLQYVPKLDRFCALGGSGYSRSGQSGSGHVDCFDFETKTWERKSDTPAPGFSFSAVDWLTGIVWERGNPNLNFAQWLWDPVHPDSWRVRNQDSNGGSLYNCTAAIDPYNQKFVAVGSACFQKAQEGSSDGDIFVWDIGAAGNTTRTAPNTLGPAFIVNGNAPGFDFDLSARRFVAWKGTANVYSFDLATMTWEEHPPAGTNTVIPTDPDRGPTGTERPGGTYGRFRYSPAKNVFVVVNSVDENVFIYKFSPGSGIPIDTTAPSAPQNVHVR